jgi:hypothetical protein
MTSTSSSLWSLRMTTIFPIRSDDLFSLCNWLTHIERKLAVYFGLLDPYPSEEEFLMSALTWFYLRFLGADSSPKWVDGLGDSSEHLLGLINQLNLGLGISQEFSVHLIHLSVILLKHPSRMINAPFKIEDYLCQSIELKAWPSLHLLVGCQYWEVKSMLPTLSHFSLLKTILKFSRIFSSFFIFFESRESSYHSEPLAFANRR